MRKKTLWWMAACLLATCGCSKKDEKEGEPIVPVQVVPVRLDSVRRLINADGVLYPSDQASVTPKISAPVQKFLVDRGDHVKQGQLLAVLENRDLTAATMESQGQVDLAEANYRATVAAAVPEQMVKARADLQAAQQALDAAQKLLDSREKLLRDGALPRRLVDEAQVGYAQARGQYEAAQEHLKGLESVGRQEQIKSAAAQVAAAKAHYQSSLAQLGYSEIHSPISGVIADRPLYAGEMASAGTPLLTVVDTSSVVARVNVPLDQARHIKLGDPATVTVSGGSREAHGKVTVVSPATDPGSTTVQVWVRVDNPGGLLKPGTAVVASIVAATIRDAAVVPVAALLPGAEGGVALMTVGADSKARRKAVKTGVRDGDNVQILEGVSAGEQVVVVGGVGLEDGAKVRIEKPAEKSKEE